MFGIIQVLTWTLLPPVFFIVEHGLFLKSGQVAEHGLERFSHAQELARNVWAAIAVTVASYFSDVLGIKFGKSGDG